MMEDKAQNRKKYISCKLNEWNKILGTFESKQQNSQFKKGNKGRKPRVFKISSRTLVDEFYLLLLLCISFFNFSSFD
jgi:hypothetical protein